MLTAPSDEFYFGYEALRRRSVLPVSSLTEHGHVLDWNHVDQFIGHVYEQLQLISAEYPVST
jgi:actin-related protein